MAPVAAARDELPGLSCAQDDAARRPRTPAESTQIHFIDRPARKTSRRPADGLDEGALLMRLFRFDRPTETADGPQTVRVLHVAQSIAGGIASYFEEIAEYQNEAFGEENVNFLIPADSDHHIASIDP